MSKQISIFDKINESAAINYEKVARRMRTSAEIAEAMKKNGLSKAEFARKMGQQQSVITKWLSGTHNFTTDTLAEISKVLNIEITGCDLAYRTDIKRGNKHKTFKITSSLDFNKCYFSLPYDLLVY